MKKTKILCTKETTGITNPGHKLANYLPQHKQIVENSTKLMRPKLCQAIPQVEKNTLRFTFPQKTQLCTSAQNKTSQKLDKPILGERICRHHIQPRKFLGLKTLQKEPVHQIHATISHKPCMYFYSPAKPNKDFLDTKILLRQETSISIEKEMLQQQNPERIEQSWKLATF